MSAKTMAQHTAADLSFVCLDESGEIATFTAASASRPGAVNTIDLDVLNGTYYCDCKAAEHGRSCWHGATVMQAWQSHQAMQEVRWMTDARLLSYGKKLALMVRVYKERTGRILPMDVLNLLAARSEYRRRQVARISVSEAAA